MRRGLYWIVLCACSGPATPPAVHAPIAPPEEPAPPSIESLGLELETSVATPGLHACDQAGGSLACSLEVLARGTQIRLHAEAFAQRLREDGQAERADALVAIATEHTTFRGDASRWDALGAHASDYASRPRAEQDAMWHELIDGHFAYTDSLVRRLSSLAIAFRAWWEPWCEGASCAVLDRCLAHRVDRLVDGNEHGDGLLNPLLAIPASYNDDIAERAVSEPPFEEAREAVQALADAPGDRGARRAAIAAAPTEVDDSLFTQDAARAYLRARAALVASRGAEATQSAARELAAAIDALLASDEPGEAEARQLEGWIAALDALSEALRAGDSPAVDTAMTNVPGASLEYLGLPNELDEIRAVFAPCRAP